MEIAFFRFIINVKSDRLYNIHPVGWNLRRNLMSKIEYFESNGLKFSHIFEMNIVFITDLTNTTYDHYLKISKPMIERTIIKKLAKNPKLIKEFVEIHPIHFFENIVILLMKKFKIFYNSFQIILSRLNEL